MTKEEAENIANKISYHKLAKVIFEDSGILLFFKVRPSPITPAVFVIKGENFISISHHKIYDWTEANEIQLIAYIYDMIAEFEVHEASEWFLYNGFPLFNSHFLQENKGPVAPRLKDIDLHFVDTVIRIDAKNRENLKTSEMQVIEFSGFNLLKRLAIAFCPSLW